MFAPEAELGPERWRQSGTWCPYAAAWDEFGPEGRRLGTLYDVELYGSLTTAYRPDIVVGWTRLQTRGDATCDFDVRIQLRRPVPD